jgi:hypothetical protein
MATVTHSYEDSSKQETHREAIFALRRKHWTHRQIANGSMSMAFNT